MDGDAEALRLYRHQGRDRHSLRGSLTARTSCVCAMLKRTTAVTPIKVSLKKSVVKVNEELSLALPDLF